MRDRTHDSAWAPVRIYVQPARKMKLGLGVAHGVVKAEVHSTDGIHDRVEAGEVEPCEVHDLDAGDLLDL